MSDESQQETKIRLDHISKVFAVEPEQALERIEQGQSKAEIYEATGQVVGVTDVSLDVYTGETLVVMGLSGCGKSTLLRCINRLTEPSAGRVWLDDVDVTALEPDELLQLRRQRFGMVFQHFGLFPQRTVAENAEFGLEICQVDKKERRQKALEALDLVGLKEQANDLPSALSGGMQQRVGLARALAVDPEVMLMDEAFSALDPLIRQDMQQELVALQERVHKTIVFISHDLDEALAVGDRIALMRDGRIIQIGTPEQILTQPADDYVEQFVAQADKTKILTAGTIMTPARAVAYVGDGPRTALRKMHKASINSIFVIDRGGRLQGHLRADAASEAVRAQQRTIEDAVEREVPAVSRDEPLTNIISTLAEWPVAIPVVDEDGSEPAGIDPQEQRTGGHGPGRGG